jgi:hypothetical protein
MFKFSNYYTACWTETGQTKKSKVNFHVELSFKEKEDDKNTCARSPVTCPCCRLCS